MSYRLLIGCVAVAVTLSAGAAQVTPLVRPKVPTDPFTGEDPGAMAKAGYVAMRDIAFGHQHRSTDVSELLGSEPLVWIETAHFRIGCALSPLAVRADGEGGAEWVPSLRAELKRLQKRLPKVKPEVRELDPWLRAHLIAQRLEDLYAEVYSVLGVDDRHFPQADTDDPAQPDQFRGSGPYVGMRQKFTVLLLRQASSHARYTRSHQQREIGDPIRFHDQQFGCMYWGGSEETADGLFRNDYALHAHLVFNVSHNLYTCYRAYGHDLPAWLVTGLAHWHSRRVSPRFPTFDRKDDKDKTLRTSYWEWDKRVQPMMKQGVFEPLDVFVDRATAGGFGIEQHIQSWSLVDFLATKHKDGLAKTLRALKAPFHARLRTPTPEELRLRQRDALMQGLGMRFNELEALWRDSVLKSKPPR